MKHLHLLLLLIFISILSFASKTNLAIHKVETKTKKTHQTDCTVTITKTIYNSYYCIATKTTTPLSCTSTATATDIDCKTAQNDAILAVDQEDLTCMAIKLQQADYACQNTPPAQ